PVNPNPAIETCKVSYRTGFSYLYKYNIPQTLVSFSNRTYTYNRPRVSVDYFTYSYTTPDPKTEVSYFTAAPTYELKRTKVVYYKEVESCDLRDGVKVNCTYAYPQSEVTLDGTYAAGCSAYVAGKLPTGALYSKAGYLPSCSVAPVVAKTGVCPNTADVQNCQMNYSASTSKITVAGVQGPSQACYLFAAGKLPAGAVYSDAGKQPTCVDKTVVVTLAGKCPAGTANCVQNYVAATPKVLFGLPANCSTIVSGQLGTHGVYTDAGKTPVCTATTTSSASASGACPTTPDPQKLNCTNTKTAATKLLDMEPVAQTCEQFANGKLGSYVITGDSSSPVTCAAMTPKTLQVTGTQSYASVPWDGYDPAKNSACSSALEAKIRTIHNLTTAPTSCAVSDVSVGEVVQSSMCSNANTASVCVAGSGKKGCASTVIPGGSPYLPLVTENRNGTFTCNTQCADTSFCAAQTGTVAQNFDSCAVSSKPAVTKKSFTGELAANPVMCATGETKVVTKGPYRANGLKTVYVAGALSESGDPAALSKYIRARSVELFGSELPAVSVFVRQPGDSLGTNGSIGASYNTFADSMSGQKRSVLSDATGYASSLQSLGQVIRGKLNRSFFIRDVGAKQSIVRAYHRKKGTSNWGLPIDPSEWSASGGTVTLSPGMVFDYGDEFKFDYQ
ncbi:MAG: hypothetical protein V4692_13590, partial [Bdellovibrionota bacterium]